MPFKLFTRRGAVQAVVLTALLWQQAQNLDAVESQPGQAVHAVSLHQVTSTLKAGPWPERDRALKQLSQVPANQGDRVWDGLVAALDAENRFVRSGGNQGDEK